MRRTLFLAGLLALLAAPAFTQGGGGRMAGPPKSGQGLLQGITLTAARAEEGRFGVAVQRAHARRDARPDADRKAPDSAMRAHMAVMRDQSMKAYRGILTAEQAKVFDQNVVAMRERARQMGGPGGSPR